MLHPVLRACALSVLLVSPPAASAAQAAPVQAAVTSALAPSAREAATVVDAFYAALRRGDTKAALAFLADSALIFESGGVERSKAEYASHHLAADAAFSKAVSSRLTRRAGAAAGNFAWIASEGRASGTFRGRQIDQATAETMVLRRTGAHWKIVHIHWSSAAAAGR